MAGGMKHDRIGWEAVLRPFFFKRLSPNTGWSATLGSLCLLLFGLLAATGMFLAMYYNPSPDKAYSSIDYIMNKVPLGQVLRGLHHWGASAMVLIVCVHLATVFFCGGYKAPREVTWIVGVLLLLATLGLGFTGYLLPWDMKAYWATVVGTNVPKGVPVVGDAIVRLLRGGDAVTGLTLTRFFAIHVLLLPASLALFAAFHIFLVRVHGLSEHRTPTPAEASTIYRFYPEHALRSLFVFAVLLLAMCGLSLFGSIPKEPVAGTLIGTYLPRPEWYYMWIFQLLTYFSGPSEEIATLGVFVIGGTLIFAVPFLGLPTVSGAAKRPLGVAVGVSAVVAVVYLTMQAYAGVKPYGDVIPVPDRQLTQAENRGLLIFVEKECSYCHQIKGRGGHRTGPDLANIAKKGSTEESLAKFVKDPRSVRPSSVMPKYELSEQDLRSLAKFMLSLDFDKYPMKVLKHEDVLKEIRK